MAHGPVMLMRSFCQPGLASRAFPSRKPEEISANILLSHGSPDGILAYHRSERRSSTSIRKNSATVFPPPCGVRHIFDSHAVPCNSDCRNARLLSGYKCSTQFYFDPMKLCPTHPTTKTGLLLPKSISRVIDQNLQVARVPLPIHSRLPLGPLALLRLLDGRVVHGKKPRLSLNFWSCCFRCSFRFCTRSVFTSFDYGRPVKMPWWPGRISAQWRAEERRDGSCFRKSITRLASATIPSHRLTPGSYRQSRYAFAGFPDLQGVCTNIRPVGTPPVLWTSP